MKKTIITTLFALFAFTNIQATQLTSLEECKVHIKEAKAYHETMKSNEVSEATLAFYKDNVVAHCGNVVSKMTYKKDFFAQQIMKKDASSVSDCKVAITIAKNYVFNGNTTEFMIDAHKTNIVDNCGTVIAKKASAYCLYDAVDDAEKI